MAVTQSIKHADVVKGFSFLVRPNVRMGKMRDLSDLDGGLFAGARLVSSISEIAFHALQSLEFIENGTINKKIISSRSVAENSLFMRSIFLQHWCAEGHLSIILKT